MPLLYQAIIEKMSKLLVISEGLCLDYDDEYKMIVLVLRKFVKIIISKSLFFLKVHSLLNLMVHLFNCNENFQYEFNLKT